MAKKKVNHKKKGFTLPIATIAGAAVGPINIYSHLMNTQQADPNRPKGTLSVENGALEALRIYTGFMPIDGPKFGYQEGKGWYPTSFMPYGLFPLIAGVMVSKVATKIGINRALASTRIPIFRI